MATSSAQAAAPSLPAAPRRRSRSLLQDTLHRLFRDPLVVVCILYLAFLLVVALFPAVFAAAPYDADEFPL